VKFKTDFVTNSSSTSFVVWGSRLDSEEVIEKFGDKLFESFKKDKYYEGQTKQEFINGVLFNEDLEDLITEKSDNLQLYCSYESEETVLGQYVTQMKDDQTLREFKEQIAEDFLKIGFLVLPEDVKYIEVFEGSE